MNKTVYDFDVLADTQEIDARGAREGFACDSQYFERLSDFLRTCPKYLQYTPTVVAYLADIRDIFIAETKEVTKIFLSLGMKNITDIFDDLAQAAQNGDVKLLSDKLVQYKAELEIITSGIKAARKEINFTPKILAVDGGEYINFISDTLAADYEVMTCVPAKADEALGSFKPDIFLISIDSPDNEGLELAKRLKASGGFSKTPVVFLSGLTQKEYVLAAKKIGCFDYIIKPTESGVLLSRLNRCAMTAT